MMTKLKKKQPKKIALLDLSKVEHSLTEFPWPYEDGTVEEVNCIHKIEYIPGKLRARFMEELWRIMTVGAKLTVNGTDTLVQLTGGAFGAGTQVADLRGVSLVYWVYPTMIAAFFVLRPRAALAINSVSLALLVAIWTNGRAIDRDWLAQFKARVPA